MHLNAFPFRLKHSILFPSVRLSINFGFFIPFDFSLFFIFISFYYKNRFWLLFDSYECMQLIFVSARNKHSIYKTHRVRSISKYPFIHWIVVRHIGIWYKISGYSTDKLENIRKTKTKTTENWMKWSSLHLITHITFNYFIGILYVWVCWHVCVCVVVTDGLFACRLFHSSLPHSIWYFILFRNKNSFEFHYLCKCVRNIDCMCFCGIIIWHRSQQFLYFIPPYT